MIERDLCVQSCYEVPGQTYPRELCWLYDNLASSKVHAEVGVYCGRSLFASCGGMSNARVYAIDMDSPTCGVPVPGSDWLRLVREATIDELSKLVTNVDIQLITTGSLAAAQQLQRMGVALDSLFIDARHHFEDADADIRAWLPLVRPGGLIAGHDYWSADLGVMRAVNEIFNSDFNVVPNTRIWFNRRPG